MGIAGAGWNLFRHFPQFQGIYGRSDGPMRWLGRSAGENGSQNAPIYLFVA
jgi:hypothetical protein